MEKKKTNWGLIIGVVIGTVALIAAGIYLAKKFLCKENSCCDCDDDELDDCDICVLADDEAEESDAE